MGDDWRFNAGGFYRYDHGVRDPGFPGIRGGQLKANVTRLLDNGYVRFSVKYIDDRNQFILDAAVHQRRRPAVRPRLRRLRLDDHATRALDLSVPDARPAIWSCRWTTGSGPRPPGSPADVGLDLTNDWHLQNTAQVMQNDQEWNALVP